MKCHYCGLEEDSTTCSHCQNPKVLNSFAMLPVGMAFVDTAHGGAWIKSGPCLAVCTEDDAAFKKGDKAGFSLSEKVLTYFYIMEKV